MKAKKRSARMGHYRSSPLYPRGAEVFLAEDVLAAENLVSEEYDVPRGRMLLHRGERNLMERPDKATFEAKHVLFHLLHRVMLMTNSQIARMYGYSETSIWYALDRVRSDMRFYRLRRSKVERCEERLRGIIAERDELRDGPSGSPARKNDE